MTFSAETWSTAREAFVFRCIDPKRGDRWTFCVGRDVLAELERTEPFVAEGAFDTWRSKIYHAAYAKMESGDPQAQLALSIEEIRRVP